MTTEVEESSSPVLFWELSELLEARKLPELSAAGGGKLSQVDGTYLERTRSKVDPVPACKEQAESLASQPGDLEERLTQGRILQIPNAVLVVLEIVEEEHGGPGAKRLLQGLPEQFLRLFRRDASRPGKAELRGDFFEGRGRCQLSARVEDEDAPAFGLAALQEAGGEGRLADAAEAMDGDEPVLLEGAAQAAFGVAAADVARFEIADPFDLEGAAGCLEGVLHRRSAPLRRDQRAGVAAGGECGDSPFVGLAPGLQLDAAGPERQGEVGAVGQAGIERGGEGGGAAVRDRALHSEDAEEPAPHQRLRETRGLVDLPGLSLRHRAVARDRASLPHSPGSAASREHQQ